MQAFAYQSAMQHPVIVEARKAGASVDYVVERGIYVISDGEWGPFEVSAEFIVDIHDSFGEEMGWQFLRHGTTVSNEHRLIASYATMVQWQESPRA